MSTAVSTSRSRAPLRRCLPILLGLLIGAVPVQAAAPELPGRHLLTLEPLGWPSGAAIGPRGRLFVVERDAHRVRLYSKTGTPTATIGRQGEKDGRFHFPTDLAIEGGEIFVLDAGNGRVQVFSLASNRWRRSFAPPLWFDPIDLRAIAVQGDRLAVLDTGRHQIWLTDREGSKWTTLGDYGTKPGELLQPAGCAFAPDGRLVVADAGNHRIQVFDLDGGEPTVFGLRGSAPGLLLRPSGVLVRDDHVLVADTENDRIQTFTFDGQAVGRFGLPALQPHEGDGRLHHPLRIALDADGERMLLCEPFESRCQLFGPGAPEKDALDPATERLSTRAHFGKRVAVHGQLLAVTEPEVAGIALHDIRSFPPVRLTRFGGPGTGHDDFARPDGLELTDEGRLIACDPDTRRMLIFAHDFVQGGELAYQPRLTRLIKAIDLGRVGFGFRGFNEPIEPTILRQVTNGDYVLLDRRKRWVAGFSSNFESWILAAGGVPPGRVVDPTDFVFDANNKMILIVDASARCVRGYATHGQPLGIIGGPEEDRGGLVRPFGIALIGGAIAVSDEASHRIVVYDYAGKVLRTFGSDSPNLRPAERLGAGQLYRPAGMAELPDGRLLVVDHGNHRMQVFNAQGECQEVFGSGPHVAPALADLKAREEEKKRAFLQGETP
ncbi:MAG: NHL repeat-containing protein [Acidobacteriota bacterium]